jgi:light-regulated signal transduction histidine kinase (bacteriophytochrome)
MQRTEELIRSNEDLQQFAHVASHDLKEPLRKIRTFSSRLISEQQNISEKAKLYLDKIQNSSERMSNLLEGILNYSIVNGYNQPFEIIDLNQIIDGIKSDLEVPIIQSNAVIRHNDLPLIRGIGVLIHQLFYNLINNSLKFSTENVDPVIVITSKKPDPGDLQKMPNHDPSAEYVTIEVADNGIGFTQERVKDIFNVFTRLNPRDKYEGTGLGLALCKKIVERHSGFIFAKGQEGQGAVFNVILPR